MTISHLRRHQLPGETCAYCGDDPRNLPAVWEVCPICSPGVPTVCQHLAPIVNGHCRACGERLFPESRLPESRDRRSYHETLVSHEEIAARSPTGCALEAPTAWFDGLELEDDCFQYQRLTFEGEQRRHEVKLEELDNPLEWNFELYVWQGFERLSRTGRRVRWNR